MYSFYQNLRVLRVVLDVLVRVLRRGLPYVPMRRVVRALRLDVLRLV